MSQSMIRTGALLFAPNIVIPVPIPAPIKSTLSRVIALFSMCIPDSP